MAEEGTKNEMMSDAEKMMDAIKAIGDAVADSGKRMDARMDAMEERQRADAARMDTMADAARKDAEEGDKEEPKADADPEDCKADAEEGDKREDSEGEEEKEPKADARKDAKKDDDDDTAADSAPVSRADFAALQRQFKEMSAARSPALQTDEEREAFAAIQLRADRAYQAFGKRAPAPLEGENQMRYRRRLAGEMQGNSAGWKGFDLTAISDDKMMDKVCDDIYADSVAVAKKGLDVPRGSLRRHVEPLESGHTRVTYYGTPKAWMGRFTGHAQRASRRK